MIRWVRNRAGRLNGYGGCYRCGDTWNHTEHHSTPITNSKACFPLCVSCWEKLSPDERLPYYQQLAQRWLDDASQWSLREPQKAQEWIDELIQEWPLLVKSVLNGL